MEQLICITSVAVTLIFIVWGVLRSKVNFGRLPFVEYRKEAEFAVFFLPAGLVGWFSTLVALSDRSNNAEAFNLAWPAGLVVAFIIFEVFAILSLAISKPEVAKDAQGLDFIALGSGYITGVIVGSYQLVVHQEQPTRITFSLSQDAIELILFILGTFAILVFWAKIEPRLKKWKRKRLRRNRKSLSKGKRIKPPDSLAPGVDTEQIATEASQDALEESEIGAKAGIRPDE